MIARLVFGVGIVAVTVLVIYLLIEDSLEDIHKQRRQIKDAKRAREAARRERRKRNGQQ